MQRGTIALTTNWSALVALENGELEDGMAILARHTTTGVHFNTIH